jgi:hypothetical protein
VSSAVASSGLVKGATLASMLVACHGQGGRMPQRRLLRQEPRKYRGCQISRHAPPFKSWNWIGGSVTCRLAERRFKAFFRVSACTPHPARVAVSLISAQIPGYRMKPGDRRSPGAAALGLQVIPSGTARQWRVGMLLSRNDRSLGIEAAAHRTRKYAHKRFVSPNRT